MERIESLLEKPKFYNNIDGVGELGMGCMILGYALLMWLQAHAPGGSLWHKVYVVLPLIFLMVSIIDRGSKAIKKRITYPRTGFVEYKKREMVWPAAIAFVTSALVAIGLGFAARSHWGIGSHWDLTTPAALFGLLFAAVYAYGVARAVRWKWAVVGAIAICSVVIAMLPADLVGKLADSGQVGFSAATVGAWLLSVLVYGVILLVSGGISFWLYLRHTQPPTPARVGE
jgi:hypothetical protein